MAGETIEAVDAREILDGRLEPTLRVEVVTSGGSVGRADVPHGRSRGANEAVEVRDGGERYRGQGVSRAVRNVTEVIAPELSGLSVTRQRTVDERLVTLDGTDDRSNLGANALTGVSLATLQAGAASVGLPLYRYVGGVDASLLPIPFFDMIEGGELAESGLDFQEHQVVPIGTNSFESALRKSAEVYYELGDLLKDEWGASSLNVGDEGGYTPPMDDAHDALDAELRAIERLGYDDEFGLALDAAATHLYDLESETYQYGGEDLTWDELFDVYGELAETFPIVSIEDPLYEEDLSGFARLADRLDVQIVGDDLFATDPARVARAVDLGAANALLLKVNQVGTVSEAMDAMAAAVDAGYGVQVSERSGQTPDSWLAELTVGLGAGQIKTGVTRSERVEQYNRLLEIEAELGGAASYPAWSAVRGGR
ncbi:phosphopyruvate hydratase [Halalkalicoccus sp. NIPERK01]|uniref:phosphopyruvate hydratase n=1 Tax=Halalkalicoccus sp. NIPERK01 TaxID=3053469 RepID=UPI00256F3824|nr:phosphopyruvate hydratase [Halalkalicoccus sp. NIPERK01]MDL5363867.1 phosphopyruvate hydratase [Halalkalicoccus sp. NIPERK01]